MSLGGYTVFSLDENLSVYKVDSFNNRFFLMASHDKFKPTVTRVRLVVNGGTLGVGDFAIQEAQRYGCHFMMKVPSDHFLVRVKYQVLQNPELYSQEKLQYFNRVFVLYDNILNVAEPFLEQANRVLKRVYPCGLEARSNRLRRYYWLVKDVAAVYAFGELSDDKKTSNGRPWMGRTNGFGPRQKRVCVLP